MATTDGGVSQAPVTGPPAEGSVWNFFRTELGKTIRVEESDEGEVRVDILKDGVWSEAPRGMIGLRLSRGSRSLTAAQILRLPFARVRLRDIQIALSP